jgi:hypothetical protein
MMRLRTLRYIARIACLSALLTCATGCSFHRAWNRAAAAPAPTDDITGRWEGTWVSEVNQHHGRLRCILTRDEAGHHQAQFHATFAGIFSASYAVPLEIRRADDEFKLHGQQDLGRFAGGMFTYDGTANPTNFFSTYRSKSDHGTFRMTRPTPK